MAPPLDSDLVDYTDGSPMTAAQYAEDVSAFLMWAAAPKMEARKQLGFKVMIFLIILAVMLYFTKQKLWRDVDH